jgi:hypothetical protein
LQPCGIHDIRVCTTKFQACERKSTQILVDLTVCYDS